MTDIASLGVKVESNLKTLNKDMEKTISLSEKVTNATEKMKAQMAGVSSTTKNVITEEVKRQRSVDNLIKSLTLQEIRLKEGKIGLDNYKASILGATDAEKKQIAALNTSIKSMQDANAAAKKHDSVLGSLITRLSALGAAYFGLQAIKEFTKDVVLLSARYETLGVVVENVGKTAGYSMLEINEQSKALQKQGISMIQSRESITKLIQAHIDLSNAQKLGRIAQDAAVIGNVNSSHALERIVYGIQTAQIEVLKSVGLNVNFENSYKKLSIQLGKSTTDLTESEKTQARLNVVLERGADIAGTYEAAMTTAGKQITSFTRYLEDYKVIFGQAFNDATTKVIAEATKWMKELTETIGGSETQTGLKQFADGLGTILSVMLKLSKVGAEIVKYIGFIGNFSENLSIEQKGIELVNKGLIDQVKYTKATWEEKKKLIAEAEPITKITKKIGEQTEGYNLYSEAVKKSSEALRNAKKEEQDLLDKSLLDQKKARSEAEKAAKKEESEEKARQDRVDLIINKMKEQIATYQQATEVSAEYQLKQEGASPAEIKLAKSLANTIDALKAKTKAQEAYKKVMDKTAPDPIEMNRQKSIEAVNQAVKDGAVLNDTYAKTLEQINNHFDKLEMAESDKALKEMGSELDKLTKFDGSSFGNTIADGINNAMISMNKLNDTFDNNAKAQALIIKLQKEISTGKGSPEERKEKLEQIDKAESKMIENQISGYRQLFGTASQLFKENSREREVMHNIEMAFAAAEIAMNLQKTISAAYTAIMTQGTGDPYSAFGRIAAMTALAGGIVAAAGGSLSGGGSGSAPTAVSGASQSTALGSTEQSQSIANAFSFLEDIESGQYNELKDISSSMKDLNKNITGLVTSIVRTGGVSEFAGTAGTSGGTSDLQNMLGKALVPWGVLGTPLDIMNKATGGNQFLNAALNTLSIGLGPINDFFTGLGNQVSSALFGGSKKTSVLASGLQITPGTIESGQYSTQAYADIKVKKEGGLFGSDKTYFKTLTDEVDQSVQDMVSLVFKNMGETMVDIAKGLGTENLEEVFNYVFDIGKIDLKGLDTEGINKALQEAFSTASDKAATDLFGELIGRYQKIGEGILETAVRLVGEKAVIMDVLELTNQGFDGSDIPAKALEVTQSLIDMAGGLDNLTDAAATYYDKFFSDAEKQTRLQGQLTESFSSLNLELPKTREGYRAIVEGLDLTTEANQKTYVSLLGLSEGADKYYTSLENGNKVLAENQKNILSINSGLEKSIAQMDMSPFEKSLDDVNTSTANTIKTLKDYGATEDQLANARLYGQKQIDFLTKAEEKRIEDLEKANKRLYDNKMVELLEAEGKSTEALILKRQLELEGMDESLVPMQKRIYELQDEKKALELSQKANKEFTDSLMASIKAQEDAIKAQADLVNNQSYDLYLELLKEEGKISSAQNLERKTKLNELNHAGLEDTQKEIWALQDKRKQEEMMVTILELEGKTTESVMLARQLEFATMEESLKPLQNRIWQLQDEKARQEEIAKTTDYLNSVSAKTIEILVLEGKTVEATALSRQIELTKMEEGLKPLQLRIWALEDAKKADEESVKAIEERIQKENSKNNMLVTLLELEGNASEALKIKRMLEINALDESLKPMQERIWALQDQAIEEQKIKTIADKRNELNIRLLKAMGKEEQALMFERTLELEAMDENLREKMKHIWMLEDEKEAQEKANVILKEKSDLELEILRLTLSETEFLSISRQKELESIDESNVALKKRIFQLTDEQAALEKAKEISTKKQSLEIEYLKLIGKESEALNLQRSLELLEIDDSLKALQERNWALQDEAAANEKLKNIFEEKSSLEIRLLEAQGKETEALALSRAKERMALDESNRSLYDYIILLEDKNKAEAELLEIQTKAEEERKSLIEKNLSEAEDMLKKSIDKQISFYQTLADEANKLLEDAKGLLDRSFAAEQESITKKHEDLIAGLTTRLEEAQTAASDLESIFNSLSDARKSMEGESAGLTYKAVQKQLIDAISMAKTGDLSGAKGLVPNLSILTSQGAEKYGSQEDYKRDFFKTYNALSELEKLAGTQLTEQQQIIKNLEIQIEQAEINNQVVLDALQNQYDAVIGLDKSVISFQDAIVQFQKAQYEADGANALLKTQTEILTNQLNALIGIDNSILSLSDAIKAFSAAQAAMGSFSQPSIPAFANGGSHYGGLRIVGEVGPEMEYTPPSQITSNSDIKSIMSNEEVVAELKAMRAELARANFELVKNSDDSKKTLREWKEIGIITRSA